MVRIFAICAFTVLSLISGASQAYEKMPWEKEGQTPACPTSIEKDADMNDEVVRKCIDIQASKINSIYQRELRKSPNTEGSAVFDITISKDGAVLSCILASTSTLPKEVANQIASAFFELKFPSSPKGWQGRFTFNFYAH